jgi:hypothetical protein
VQFLAQELVITSHTTYPKLGYRGPMDFEIFTFLFFMSKISRNSLGEYNKSCSAPDQESSKIEFEIFRIFYDFLEILQDPAKVLHY